MKTMCKVLKIIESGYYRWLKNKYKPSARQLLSVEIKKILNTHPANDNYGDNRIQITLEQSGNKVSRRTVYRAMFEMGLLHRTRKPHGTTKATTEIRERENLIKRDFTAKEPLRKILSDITAIQCRDGKLYLSAALDCYNGEILSIAMNDNMKKELCIRTVNDMKNLYGKSFKGAIFHTYRGSQYTSASFREALMEAGLRQSLSGVGHCFDNARMESFFATLKKEKIYRISACKLTREQVKTIIFRYIFVYYNRIRICTTNPNGMPPAVYREWTERIKSDTAA